MGSTKQSGALRSITMKDKQAETSQENVFFSRLEKKKSN